MVQITCKFSSSKQSNTYKQNESVSHWQWEKWALGCENLSLSLWHPRERGTYSKYLSWFFKHSNHGRQILSLPELSRNIMRQYSNSFALILCRQGNALLCCLASWVDLPQTQCPVQMYVLAFQASFIFLCNLTYCSLSSWISLLWV